MQQDYEVLDIMIEISETSSKNDKQAILDQHYNNEHLQRVLEYTFNPFKVYGIGNKAFGKKFQIEGEKEFDSIINLLDYLLENKTGTDVVKLKVNAFILQQPEQYRELLKKIILKNPTIGITGKTANKVWNELVPTFDVMLAEPLERFPKHAAVEYKFDGVRATGVKIKGKTQLFTRNGKKIEGFDSIIKQLDELPYDDVAFDGELISDNDYNSTMEKVFKKSGNKEADYMMFDILPLSEFNNGQSTDSYKVRRELLEIIFERNAKQNLRLAPIIAVLKNPTIEQINELTQQAVDAGFEGTIVKDMDALYYCKRTYDWQKVKLFVDGDFEIVRIEEGKGKNKGRMGKVIIDVNGVEVGLGTGWTDQERIDMWNNQGRYISQIVEVQYQEVIEKSGSLRFPSVKGIRWDK